MITIFGDDSKTSGLLIKTKSFDEQSFTSENLFVHLLQGEVKIAISDKTMNLSANSMMLVRQNEHISIKSQREDTYLLVYAISSQLLNQYVDMTSNTIETAIIDNDSSKFKTLEKTSKSIILALRKNNGTMDFHLRGLASELLYVVTKKYLVKRKVKKKSDSRILEALLYIETNYKNIIGLEDIANYFKVSSSYFSRYFKNQTGSSFIEYLTDYRLEKAAKRIIESSEKISVIANQTGFTNINSFNKKFKIKFGDTPREYRRKNTKTKKNTRHAVHKEIFTNLPLSVADDSKIIEVDYSKDNRIIKNNFPWKRIINIGSAEDLLQYDLRNHIKLLKKDLDISYIRFWNIFTKEMNIDPTITANYNFEKIDSILDFLLDEGLKPFIELRYKVRRIHRSTKETLIYDNKNFKFSLNSLEWFDMIEKFMKHVNNRYGKKIVNEWMFEFSFEHYQGENGLRELISHYKKTYEIIKRRNPVMKIGGPGAPAQNNNNYKYKADLLYFQKEHVNFDFVSYTIFPYLVGIDGEKNAQRIESEDYLVDTVSDIIEVVDNSDYQGTEIIITEWNNTISNRNSINDTLYKGSYLIKNFSEIVGKIDGIAYWIGSDLFSEFIDSRDILHGGAGLIARGPLLKPVFHAYRFMNFLDNQIILNTNGVIATYNEDSEEYSLILYNYQGPSVQYYVTEEDKIQVDDIHQFFDDNDKKEIKINFSMEPNKKFELKTFSVNNEYGNIISGWKDIGLRSSLRSKDLEYLQLKANPKIEIKQLYSDINGNLLIEEFLEPNQFGYMSLYPIDD